MRSSPSSFADACDALAEVLGPAGPRSRGSHSARRAIVDELSAARDLGAALTRLCDAMRANVLEGGGRRFAFASFVNAFDRRTQQEGFHVLHDWDGKADHVVDDTIPVDVCGYVASQRRGDAVDPAVLAIGLDYYLFHLMQLLSLRIWDDGDADARLDRLGTLLEALQGPGGSGQPFVADAETLILVATSHFELQERGYGTLLARVRTLSAAHQLRVALGHAASMGSHLRFGFEATYARDTIVMRDDNVADYPWLCYALAIVSREWARLHGACVGGGERERVVEALLNGLSADARAFVGEAPASLARCDADRREIKRSFEAQASALVGEFEAFRPIERRYSPLSFFFNFSHNVLKGIVVDAMLRGEPWDVSFNDLLTALPRGSAEDDARAARKELLANTLMTYARLNPDRIRGQLMPVIVYDPAAGRQAFGTTLRRLRGQ